ncbi:RNA polymerase I-specific transcription initiation factor RRN3-like [Pecten maximus]|uniref:RNA polymerase I-specific transcription initiation factor RRN3-like n=1 Tax=Pecten maximus TaxID=6579 RepID=UPI0014590772|nr:RNA polymerase I-specific transcription initiation factor RRN3-like [Pecten maximus]
MSSEHQPPRLENILKNHKRGLRHDYDVFLSKLGSPNISSAELKSYIQSLRDCITFLDKDHEILVGVLLKVDWTRRESAVVLEYQALLHNLVSAHTYYLRAGLRMLVKHFLPKITENFKDSSSDSVVLDSQQLQDHETSFINVHLVIKAISNIVPMSPTVLTPLLSDYFPYMTKDKYLQECYVKNLLQITHYMPQQRLAILELIVDRMLKLDVRSPKHEIAEAEDNMEEENDIIFDMDDPSSTQEVLSTDAGYRSGCFEIKSAKPMNHKEAERLDVMMDLVLKYIQQTCFHEGQLKWDDTKKLYRELLLVFERLILPTHASCHVQFIMFSLCAIKQPICEGFLDFLWKKVQDPNTEGVYRQASVSYIGSLLSRGLFVPISTVMACLGLMCDWVHKYLDQVGSCVHADVSHHGPFYSVCQTIFYVFVFRSKELLEMKKGYKWAEGLNFQRIVTSRLNPLRVCLPVIVKSFASVTRTHQLAFCDTIIERNFRCFLPSSTGKADLLNEAFPFDPYILHRSRKFIVPHYREYQGNVVQEDNDTEDEEDDFITDDIMSVKDSIPVLSVGKSPTDFMAYSVSPGFKQTLEWPQSMEG